MPTCHEQVCYLKMAWNLLGKQSFLESLEMEEKILELAEIGVIGVAGVEVSERVMTVSHTQEDCSNSGGKNWKANLSCQQCVAWNYKSIVFWALVVMGSGNPLADGG